MPMHFEDQGTSSGIGNLFGENNAAQLAAQRAMIQRAQALQQAQLSPAQSGTFMATQAGNMFGNAIGSFARPDPRQMKLAQIKQAVDQEAQDAGITDPEQYLRLAASHLIKGGEYPSAVEAQKQADSLASSGSKRKLTEAQAAKEFSEAGKITQSTLEAISKQPYEVALAKMKAEATDPESRERIAKADQMIKDSTYTDRKFEAEIAETWAKVRKANAEAGNMSKGDRESLNEQAARLNEYMRLQKAKGLIPNPADIQALEAVTRILAKAPQPTIQSVIAKDMAAKQAAAAPSNVATGKITIQPTGKDKAGKPYYKWPDGTLHYSPPK